VLRDTLLAYAEPRLIEQCHVDQEGNEILAYPSPAFVREIEGTTANLNRLRDVLNPVLNDPEAWELRQRAEIRTDYRYEQLAEALDRDTNVTPLPSDWPIASMTDYHAARLNALLRDQPETPISRGELSDMVGCSNGLLDAVMAQAGVESRDNHQLMTFTGLGGQPVAVQVRAFCRRHKGQPYAVEVQTETGKTLYEAGYTDINALQAQIEARIPQGQQVVLKVRCASLRRVTRHTPPQDEPAREPVGTTSPTSAAKPRRKPYRGREHHPDWRLAQLRLALAALGQGALAAAADLLDAETGEIIPNAERERALLGVLLGDRDVRPLSHEKHRRR
jgi:hypothetical protein